MPPEKFCLHTSCCRLFVSMEGNNFFTTLLNGSEHNICIGWDGFGSPPEGQESPNTGTTDSRRVNKKRLKNFSDKEDLLLVRAWLTIGADPVDGKNQKRTTYWARIYDFFHAEKEIVLDRSQNSLMHRWSTIQESVNKFCGCISRIEGRNESGKTFENKVVYVAVFLFYYFSWLSLTCNMCSSLTHALCTRKRIKIKRHFNSCIAGTFYEMSQSGMRR